MTTTIGHELRACGVRLGRVLTTSDVHAALEVITLLARSGLPLEHMPVLTEFAMLLMAARSADEEESILRVVKFIVELRSVTDIEMVLNDTVQHKRSGWWSSDKPDALHFQHFRLGSSNYAMGWTIEGHGIKFTVEIANKFWQTSSSDQPGKVTPAIIKQKVCDGLADGRKKVTFGKDGKIAFQ